MAKKRLNLMDGSWLLLETPETPMHVATLQILSKPKNAGEDFLNKLLEQMRAHDGFRPPFNLKLASGWKNTAAPAFVEDDDIDIDYHLRHSGLPRPGGMRELGVLISRLHSTRLDRSRPLWECHVIEGLEDDRQFAIYTKVHHSLIDGVGGMRLLQSCYSEDARKRKMPPPWAQTGAVKKTRGAAANITDVLANIRGQAATQLKSMPGVLRAFRDMGRAALRRDSSMTLPYSAPRSVLNVPITGQRRFAIQSFPIERIKAVGKATGTTINDVCLALCAGALRRYLIELGELPEAPLIANLPVSIRPAGGASSGNAISTMLATLATDIEDPVERLKAIHESTSRGKQQLQKMTRSEIMNYTVLVMAPFSVGQLVGIGTRGRPMFNTVVSNVPGPKKPLYFNGARLEELYPVSLLFSGQALNITVTSYVDKLDFAFTACRSALPHIQRVAVYTGDAMQELEHAAA